jgi:hypothetical protein
MASPSTVPIPRKKPPAPWHARPGVLRAVVAVLAVLVLGEGLVLMRLEQRLDTMLQRLEDARTLASLGLGERPGRLLMITDRELSFSANDLRTLQAQVDGFMAEFVQRNEVEPELAEMLAGVLSSHVTSYGDARIQASLGALRLEEQERYFLGLQTRCYRTAELLLGRELGSTFGQEFDQAWRGWTANH